MLAERFAALVDRNAFLKLHVTALEPAHDDLEFLQGRLEGEALDVGGLGGGGGLVHGWSTISENQNRRHHTASRGRRTLQIPFSTRRLSAPSSRPDVDERANMHADTFRQRSRS